MQNYVLRILFKQRDNVMLEIINGCTPKILNNDYVIVLITHLFYFKTHAFKKHKAQNAKKKKKKKKEKKIKETCKKHSRAEI